MDQTFSWDLGDLANPLKYHDPIEIGDAPTDLLIRQLRTMLLIRLAEERIGDDVATGLIKCPCHLGIGQEAIAVGISSALRPTDRTFGAHRSHTHFLAQGGDVGSLFSEVLGKVTGCSRGMGGSMHISDESNGFWGSVPIVSATVSLAVGAGLAAQLDGSDHIGVSYFGDGAAEEGTVHESMNFAAAYKTPVLFVCENNLFASHLFINIRQPANSIARFAAAHRIPFEVVDGNDVVTVARTAQRLAKSIREGHGPAFIEAVTYRWRGHVGPREDNDVGVTRKENLVHWKGRDPIRRLKDSLIRVGALTEHKFQETENEVRSVIQTEWKKALDAPFPHESALLDHVYSQRSHR